MASTEDILVKDVGPVIQMGMYNVLSRQPVLATVNPNMDAERTRPQVEPLMSKFGIITLRGKYGSEDTLKRLQTHNHVGYIKICQIKWHGNVERMSPYHPLWQAHFGVPTARCDMGDKGKDEGSKQCL
jgi:hypothetical protein